MIETTYVRLEQAAAMLDTDADTLLIAAAEGRIRLYWLLNTLMGAQSGYWDEFDVHPDHGPAHGWVPTGKKLAHFMFAPLPRDNAGDLLKANVTEWEEDGALTDPDADGGYWVGANAESGIQKSGAEWKRVTRQAVFMATTDVAAIKSKHATPAPGTIKDAPMPDRSHASDRLALLNQASRRWWANASEGDPSTHPKNSDVAAWLADRGMSASQAKHAAAIIRPEWAHSGRKPDA